MHIKPLIFDDFLDSASWTNLLEYYQKIAAFRYGHFSDQAVTDIPHWHSEYLFTNSNVQTNQEHILRANPNLAMVAAVWERLKEHHLKGHALVRCYANAHTYGVEGAPHVDSAKPNNFTTLLYVVPDWKTQWAGETSFFNESGEVTTAVLPRPNRMITFDGTQLHAARAVSRECPALRITLMFKTVAPSTASIAVDVKANP